MSSPLPKALPDFLISTPKMVEKVWGGTKLNQLFSKGDASVSWGESWEVADLKEGQSRITNQNNAHDLHTYVSHFGTQFIGTSEERFPLLLKLIHAAEDLSVQVHPGHQHIQHFANANSKDECWYILDVAPNAYILHGLNDPTLTHAQLQNALKDGDITKYLRKVPVQAGDVISIPPGTAHAICAGIVLLELQEPSDTTFRLWDYNRPGLDGKPRQLHQKEGLQVIQYGEQPTTKETPTTLSHPSHQLLLQRPQFRMEKVAFHNDTTLRLAIKSKEALTLICTQGHGTISGKKDQSNLDEGQTIIIPAQTKAIELTASKGTHFILGGRGQSPLVHVS